MSKTFVQYCVYYNFFYRQQVTLHTVVYKTPLVLHEYKNKTEEYR